MELSKEECAELVDLLEALLDYQDFNGSCDIMSQGTTRRWIARLSPPITRHRIDQIAAGAK